MEETNLPQCFYILSIDGYRRACGVEATLQVAKWRV
jgi:hypothetical protein